MMDVTYTDFALEMNFDAVYQKSYKNCRNDTECDRNLGSEIELINKMALDHIEEDGDETAANNFME